MEMLPDLDLKLAQFICQQQGNILFQKKNCVNLCCKCEAAMRYNFETTRQMGNLAARLR